MRIQSARILLRLGLLLLLAVTSVFGQGDWSANLNFDPFPSPYISDWENNPAIGQALITNSSSDTVSVRVFLTIIHDTRGKIASAYSRSFDFPPGASSSLTTRDMIDDQSVEYDHSIRETAERTGRLPEGKYRVCLRLEMSSGGILLDNQCSEFTIVYPDPPYLVFPANGESVTNSTPILQWTPVQVPVGYQVHYDLSIAEVLQGQTPNQALAANYPQYRGTNLSSTSLQYPLDALTLQKGKTYAWQVQVLDDRGYPPSTNNGRSEIWTFLCDVDTIPAVELRQLAGHVYDSATGQALGSARVVYRAVHRDVHDKDTSWVDGKDSLVFLSDQSGYFRFDSAIDKSYYSLSVTRADYQTVHLAGQNQYQSGNVKDLRLLLSLAPPGTRRLAGILKDFYSNEPVPNATVVYHVVDAKTVSDSTGPSRTNFVENSRKVIQTTTDAAGRFVVSQAADSSFFSLRASKSPSFLPATDMGPDQRQVGDIDDYILLIKPNAGSITGRLVATIGGKTEPVSKAIVRVTRSAVVTVKTTCLGISTTQTVVQSDTTGPSTYSDANGYFKLQRLSQEKPSYVENGSFQLLWTRIPVQRTTTYQSYSYRISVNDRRYQRYLSRDSVVISPGETTESGEHELTPRAGSIAGRIQCDTSGVEGARVYLYRASTRQITQGDKGSLGSPTGSKTSLGTIAAASEEAGRPLPANDTTWGNTALQRPSGEPLDYRQTDRTGIYIFPTVPINDPDQQADRYTVWVEADGFNDAAKGDRIGAENEADTVNFGLTRVGGVIFGEVTDADGAKISNARIELLKLDSLGADSSQPKPVWVASGGDGGYSLGNINPGLYLLKFSKPGFSSLTTDSFRVDYGDKLLRDVTLNAAKGFIALTITDKDAKGLSDVCVKSEDIPSLMGFTDRDGKILISDAIVGSVKLKLRKVGYADLDTALTVPSTDTLKAKLKMQLSVGELLVRVVEKGNPDNRLAKMTVKIGKPGEASSAKDSALTKTTSDIGDVVFKEAPTGKQTITVTPPLDSASKLDYVIVETQVEVFPGLNAKPVVIEMEPAARIKGLVKNKDGGTPLGSVTVSLEGSSKVQAKTDSSGAFELRNVPTGESATLVAFKCGFKSARFKYDKRIAAGDKITGISIELEKSPMDSLFGFPIALDSVKTGSSGRNRVWGTLLDVPATFGVKLKNEATHLTFADVEVDSAYKPTSDSLALTQGEVEIDLFGLDGKMSYPGGLCLQWIDSVKAGRISGQVTINDPISKIFSETKFLDLTIPKKEAPSFWAGGVNRGLSRFGLTATKNEVEVQIKAVKIGLDFVKSKVDTAGLHLYGSIHFGSTFEIGFEEMLIGKDQSGDIALKSITLKTKPAIKIPFGVFTVVDSSMTWEATGFKASGAIVLNALQNREFGFKDLRISPSGEFLSLTVTADKKNGTISVCGQSFQIEKIEFGTENFASTTLEHTKYFAFAGKLSVKSLDQPVGVSLRYTEKGLFTGKLDFNQSRSFGGIVTISLETIEIGYDSAKTEQFVGISGGVKFGAINGLKLQASKLRFYFGGDVAFDEISMDFIAGPVQVKVSVKYANSVFEGKGYFEVKPVLSAGAEFRYGGSKDWWVRIISGTRIPIGPCEIVQASGGIGRKDDTWRFSVGGIVAPAKADKGIRLDLLVDVQMTPQGVIILGNANVDVAGGTQIGKATIEINIPDKRVSGSIVFGMDFKALKASAQLDLCVKFNEYWYVYGRANIDVLKFFKNDGLIIVANNWTWQHDGQSRLMNGIYVELNSVFGVNANWYVIKWGVNFDRHAMVYIGWNGDFAGSINMAGGAYAWIGFGPFDLIQARADMSLAAHLSYIEPEWSAGARGHFSLAGSIGWCSNANCWSICWKCFIKIFGHCIFALPTGAKACIGMDAYIEYATSKGMSWSISF